MAGLAPLKVRVESAISDEFKELAAAGSAIEGDVIDKVNAGAALTFALFHSGADFMKTLPTSVLEAYLRAADAYSVRAH